VLQRAITDGRKPHAWIFSGPLGVGKYTTAIQFAAHILNISQEETGLHPDIHVVRKEDVVWSQNPQLRRRKQTNIPIDLLRERMIGGRTSDDRNHDAIAYKTPRRGSEKVFIIDEAELLDESGQNALLKTLEEPPINTTILLVTCRDDLMLPTIQSRCQTVMFSPLDSHAMQEWAQSQNHHDVDSLDLSWAIDWASGSPGLVVAALQSDLPAVASTISSFLCMKHSDYTGAVVTMIDFVEQHVARSLKENTNASKEAANRNAIELLLLVFSQVAKEKIRGNDVERGVLAAGIVVDVERQLSTNISIKVLLESLAARWSNLCVGDAVFM